MQLIVSDLIEAQLAVRFFLGLEVDNTKAPEVVAPKVVKATKAPKESTESSLSIDDLRAAAMAHKDAHDKDATLAVLGGRKLADIDSSEYAAVIKALAI